MTQFLTTYTECYAKQRLLGWLDLMAHDSTVPFKYFDEKAVKHFTLRGHNNVRRVEISTGK